MDGILVIVQSRRVVAERMREKRGYNGLHASRIYLASIDNLSVKIDDERRIGLLLIISYIYYSERGETQVQAICECELRRR